MSFSPKDQFARYNGYILDATGAPISGASVLVTDLTGNSAFALYDSSNNLIPSNTVTTDSTGLYYFYAPPFSVFDLTVSGSGFSTYTINAEEVGIGKPFNYTISSFSGGFTGSLVFSISGDIAIVQGAVVSPAGATANTQYTIFSADSDYNIILKPVISSYSVAYEPDGGGVLQNSTGHFEYRASSIVLVTGSSAGAKTYFTSGYVKANMGRYW